MQFWPRDRLSQAGFWTGPWDLITRFLWFYLISDWLSHQQINTHSENLKAIGSQRITIVTQNDKMFSNQWIILLKNQQSKPEAPPMPENTPEVPWPTGNELSNEPIEIFQIEKSNHQLILLHWNLILRHHNSFHESYHKTHIICVISMSHCLWLGHHQLPNNSL